MMEGLVTLIRRRDCFLWMARAFLLAAVLLWFLGVVLYDIGFDKPQRFDGILIGTSIADLTLLAKVDASDVTYPLWGGPTTAFGLQSFAFAIGAVAIIAFIRARLNHGHLSRIGIAFLPISLVAGSLVITETATWPRPQILTVRSFATVRATVESLEPGLIARLERGERPSMPATATHTLQLYSPDGRKIQVVRKPGEPWLESRGQEAGLRFALAQQAFVQGDRQKLRRLLPISLDVPEMNLSARNDFARRLALMQAFAGVPSAAEADAEWIAAGEARWRSYRILGLTLRYMMQVCLLIGLASAAIALVMRRRVRSVNDKLVKLDPSFRG